MNHLRAFDMAEGKKSFVLYADLLQKVDHLTNEELGVLFRHMLNYVNDNQPVLENRLILTAWKPIEVSLKEDLKKWERIREKRSEAGAKGGRPPKAKKANAFSEKQSKAKKAVTDTVTVTVTDTVDEDKSSSVSPPTFEEWSKRWEEKGRTTETAHCLQAYEYWESQNWMRNGKPIQNWALTLVNNPRFKDCPKAKVNLFAEHIIQNVPKDWLKEFVEDRGWTRKEAVEAWKSPTVGPMYREAYYFPQPQQERQF